MDVLAEYGRPIISLFVVFGLLALTVWKLGRARATFSIAAMGKTLSRKARGEERILKTVERLALTPQHTIHVLRLHDREILVATHPQGCTVLDDASKEVARGAGA